MERRPAVQPESYWNPRSSIPVLPSPAWSENSSALDDTRSSLRGDESGWLRLSRPVFHNAHYNRAQTGFGFEHGADLSVPQAVEGIGGGWSPSRAPSR